MWNDVIDDVEQMLIRHDLINTDVDTLYIKKIGLNNH
jgi:hypothetical protein